MIGKAYRSLIETLPVSSAQEPLQGRRKQVQGGAVQALQSAGMKAGVTDAAGDLFELRSSEGLPTPLGAPQLPAVDG